MTDRELLELAAKAAGLDKLTLWTEKITDYDSDHYGRAALYQEGSGGQCLSWNPLINDGNALWLVGALKLNIEQMPAEDGDGPCVCVTDDRHKDLAWESFAEGSDRLPATRRAIVRAAAEIGRTMP